MATSLLQAYLLEVAHFPARHAQALVLNAVFGLCLGCEMYLLIRRVWPGRQSLAPANADKEF
jgi:Domain of unknown function (DUF4395)